MSNFSRRKLLIGAGFTSAAGVLASQVSFNESQADAASLSLPQPQYNIPVVDGLHLQFGADPATEMTVSWHTLAPVVNPRVFLGSEDGSFIRIVPGISRSYVDGKSKVSVYGHHCKITGLTPDTEYMYAALHDGATPQFGEFASGIKGKQKLVFTSFGDQGTPTVGKYLGYENDGRQVWANDNNGTATSGDIVVAIEQAAPMFHLYNGDLSYANLSHDRVRTWWDFWANNTRSARNRPWMPCLGNHEVEKGNGIFGVDGYQTYFELPQAKDQDLSTKGLWYGFTVGTVRFISLANDDVCYTEGADIYLRGFSKGAQKAWLEQELAAARKPGSGIDWVIVYMHQPMLTTVTEGGADLGVRQEWGPLFDKYHVDLVLAGHVHSYERSYPILGNEGNKLMTPIVTSKDASSMVTGNGAPHMVIGTAGVADPTNKEFSIPAKSWLASGVDKNKLTKKGKYTTINSSEPADWLAYRALEVPYGFALFELIPGAKQDVLQATFYSIANYGSAHQVLDTFKLVKNF